MKALIALGVAAVLLSTQTFAASDFYEKSRRAQNIYFDTGFGTIFFGTPTEVPRRGAEITSVSWGWSFYQNGVTTQEVRLCYRPEFSVDEGPCLDISGAQAGSTDIFNGLDARGNFTMRHTLYGGTYPVYPTHEDTIIVDYIY